MKKLFAIIAMFGVFAFGATQAMMAQTDEAAAAESDSAAAMVDSAAVDSAAIGDFVPVDRFKDIQNLNFHLDIDGKTVQRGNTADMLFKVDEIIAYVSRFFTLKIGDLLYTGTPVGVGPVGIGQHLQGYLEGEKLLDFYVR